MVSNWFTNVLSLLGMVLLLTLLIPLESNAQMDPIARYIYDISQLVELTNLNDINWFDVYSPNNLEYGYYSTYSNKWIAAMVAIQQRLDTEGVSHQDLILPLEEERLYHMFGYLPKVHESMRYPFRMPLMADEARGRLLADNSYVDWIRSGLTLLSGPSFDIPTHDVSSDQVSATFQLKTFPDTLGEDAQQAIYDGFAPYINAYIHAERLLQSSLENLTSEEIQFIKTHALDYIRDSDGEPGLLTALNIDMQVDILHLMRKIDYGALFCAGMRFASVTEELIVFLQQQEIWSGSHPLVFETEYGELYLSGVGADRIDVHAWIHIDLGGNDRYELAQTLQYEVSPRVLVDLAGDDTYEAHGQVSWGSTVLGVSMMVDVEGDDVYTGEYFSQGAAFGGVGFLHDRSGNDEYTALMGSQGAALFGLGLLVDDQGSELYHVGALGQAFSSSMGIGILVDRTGSDTYVAGKTYGRREGVSFVGAQGFSSGMRPYPWDGKPSIYGGIAVLLDGEGDDIYESEVWTQGSSYFQALGMLIDVAGNDFYESHNYGMGTGTHLSSGIMVDYAGNDVYRGGSHSNGGALDKSAGIQLDYEGDDIYDCSTIGLGVKTQGIGVFVDMKGDDWYKGNTGHARLEMENTRKQWNYGLFFDLGGTDQYASDRMADNQVARDGIIGVSTDMEWDTSSSVSGNIAWHTLLPHLYYSDDGVQMYTPFQNGFHVFTLFSKVLEFSKLPLAELVSQYDWHSFPSSEYYLEAIRLRTFSGMLQPNERRELYQLLDMNTLPPDIVLGILNHLRLTSYPLFLDDCPMLQYLQSNTNRTVKQYILELQESHLTQAWVDYLLEKLEAADLSPTLEEAYIETLGGYEGNSQTLCDWLWKEAKTATSTLRQDACLRVFTRLADSTHVSQLLELMERDDPYLSIYAGVALLRLDDERGYVGVIQALEHPNVYQQGAMQDLLEVLTKQEGIKGKDAWMDWYESQDAFPASRAYFTFRNQYHILSRHLWRTRQGAQYIPQMQAVVDEEALEGGLNEDFVSTITLFFRTILATNEPTLIQVQQALEYVQVAKNYSKDPKSLEELESEIQTKLHELQ